MKNLIRTSSSVLFLSVSFFFSSFCAYAEVTAISANQHPNLFFNQQEIDAMRQAVLVDRSPSYAVTAYNKFKGTKALGMPQGLPTAIWKDNYDMGRPAAINNMKACFSYMLEPTQEKAKAIASALRSWTSNPNRGWAHDAQGAGHAQYPLAWMYDLVYNAGVLSDEDKASMDDFFSDISRVLAFSKDVWRTTPKNDVDAVVGQDANGNDIVSHRESYENWWQLSFHAGVVFALVSHDQSAVDRIFKTDVPETYYLRNMDQYNGTRDLKNMLNGLIFPSGYDFDTYHRDLNFEGQHYHFFNLMPAAIGAEAAYHNGFNAWEYKDQGLRRVFRTGAPWAGTAKRGEYNYNWLPFFWVAYRRFPDDAVIKESVAKEGAMSGLPWIFDTTLPLWGVLGDVYDENNPPPSNPAPETNSPPSAPRNIILQQVKP